MVTSLHSDRLWLVVTEFPLILRVSPSFPSQVVMCSAGSNHWVGSGAGFSLASDCRNFKACGPEKGKCRPDGRDTLDLA